MNPEVVAQLRALEVFGCFDDAAGDGLHPAAFHFNQFLITRVFGIGAQLRPLRSMA